MTEVASDDRTPQDDGDHVTPERGSSSAEREGPATFVRRRASGAPLSDGDGLYRLLVESVRDYAIFALDPKGYIVSWNAGAQRFKGYKPDEIIGKHFSVFYPESDIAAGKPAWELMVAERDGQLEDEGWRLRKDGTRFWANVVITALRDERGALVGFAKVTRDLTERRLAEERALADARRLALAEEANRAKAGFLAAMSHELRTPLNAIAGYADLLVAGIGGPVTEQQRQYIQRIRDSQQHLLSVINDILNFSRIEAGQLSYDIARVQLRPALVAVLSMVEPQGNAKQQHVLLADGADTCVLADRAKLEQILLNLLSNAVKFTPNGGRIDVSWHEVNDRVVIRVRDTGIGIPAAHLDTIFEPFVQVGRSLTSAHEGAGLGLAISSDLARAMNGDLTVESTVGVGSTFTLALPAG